MKVVLIQSLLSPYRYPIYRELTKIPGWDFEVWFMGKRVKNRKWGEEAMTPYNFKYRFLEGITIFFGRKDVYPFWINLIVVPLLLRTRPDVVVMMGWDSLTSFLAHIYCKLSGKKFLIYSDSTLLERSWRRFITLLLVKVHVRASDALIAGGTRAKAYLESLGVKPERIFVSFNTIDVDKYKNLTDSYRKISSETRKTLGVSNKRVIMYYAQFIERKGADILLLAYEKLKEKYQDIALLLIGDGPFRKDIERLIKEREIRDVVLLDNPGDENICKYYAIASIFVLPSREDVWGLVVNEAMAAGLPVVVSDKAGCSADLIGNEDQGLIFNSEDIGDLSQKIEKILLNKTLSKKLSFEASRQIKFFEPTITVRRFSEAIESPFININSKIEFQQESRKNFISVIIPVRGNRSGLNKTLESLKKQKKPNFDFEIIVEKDEKGNGSYSTRNKALLKAKGEFIAFIDAGTIAPNDWLMKGFNSLKKYDYVGGPIEVRMGEYSKVEEPAFLFGRIREFAVEEFFRDLHFIPATNLFVRREVIEKLGGFDGRLESSGDLEFGDRVHGFPTFSQSYNPGLKVYHPARSYNELVEKQRRLARGFVDLGGLYPKRFPQYKSYFIKSFIKVFIPPVWLIWKKSLTGMTLSQKLRLILSNYILSFDHHKEAIRYGFLRVW